MKPPAILFRPGNIWQNIKTSQRYRTSGVVTNATNAENGQRMVVYRSTSEDDGDVFVREAREFLEKFKPLDFWEDD